MNRFQRAYQYQLSKDKLVNSTPKPPDMMSLLYDEEFIASINSVSRIIKNFYKTKSILFANMKQYISNQNLTNVQSTFEAIDKSYAEFYADAKSIFKKMKSIRNENLEKIRASEGNAIGGNDTLMSGGRVLSSHSNRCNTIGASETIRSSLNKTDVSISELKLKYEQIKSENTLLKKKIDVFQAKSSTERSVSQMRSSQKDYFSNITVNTNSNMTTNTNTTNNIIRNKELIDFANAVNKFLQTINKLQSKNISIELDNNLSDLRKYSLTDKQIKQNFTKEKFELSKLCIKYLNTLQLNKTVSTLFSFTPTNKKSLSIKSYIKSNQDSSRDLKELINYSQSDLSNHSTAQMAFLSKENEQFKNDFNHLNNVHMIEISKNKALTEQVLKLESESAILNKEKAMLNDKYLKLFEEKELLVSSMNSQIAQLKKIASTNTQGLESMQKKNNALIQENKQLQTEIERLNNLMEVFQSKKREMDNQEKTKLKKADNQLNSLSKKNTDLVIKIATVTNDNKKLKQGLLDKEAELTNMSKAIAELSEVNQKNIIDLQVLNNALDSEQKKTLALRKENEDMNNKFKELLEAFNQRHIDLTRENIERSNKKLLMEIREKNKEIQSLSDLIQLKDKEIRLEKDNVIVFVNKHTDELNKEKEKWNKMITQIQELHLKEKTQLEDYVKSLKASFEKKESGYKLQFTELSATNHDLNNMLSDKHKMIEENTAKQNQINKLSSIVEAKEIVNAALREENEKLNKTLIANETKINQLNHSMDQLNEIISKQHEDCESMKTEYSLQISKIKGEMDIKDKELFRFKELYNLNSANQSILNELITKMNKNSSDLIKIKDTTKTENLSKIITNKDEEIKELRNTMRSIDQQLTDLKATESNLTQMIQMKDCELNKLSVLHSDLINELLIIQNNIAQGEQLIASLKQENYNNENVIDEYKAKANEKDNEIVYLNKQIELLQGEDNNTITILNNKSNELKSIKEELNEKVNNVIMLELDNKNAKEQLRKLQISFAEEINAKERLMTEVNELKETITVNRKEVSEMSVDLTKAREELKQKENGIDRLNKTIKAKDEEIKKLIKMSDPKEDQIKEMTQLLEAKKDIIETKDDQLKRVTEELNSMYKNNKTLANELEAINQKNNCFEESMLIKEKECNEVKRQLGIVIKEKEELISTGGVRENQLTNLHKELNDKDNVIRLLQSQKIDLEENTIMKLKDSIDKLEKDIQSLNNCIQEKEDQITQRDETSKSNQSQIELIMNQVQQCKFTYDELNNKLKETTQRNQLRIEEKDKEIAALSNQLTESRNDLSKMNQTLIDSNTQMNILQSRVNQLSEEHKLGKRVYDDLKTESNEQLINITNERDDLQLKTKEANDIIISNEKTIEELNKQINELNININQFEEQKKKYLTTIKESNEKIEDLNGILIEKQKVIESTKNESQQWDYQCKLLQKNQKELMIQIENRNEAISIHKSELENINKTIKASNNKEEKSLKTIEGLNKELETQRTINEDLKKQYVELQSQNEEVKDTLEKESIDYKNQLSNLKKEKEGLLKDNENKKEELNQLKTAITKLNKSEEAQLDICNELKTENEKLKSDNKQLLLSSNELKTQNLNLSKETKELKSSIANLNKDITIKDKSIDELRDQLLNSSKENSTLQNQITKLHKETKQLNKTIQSLVKDKEDLQTETQSLTEANESLSNKNIDLNEETKAKEKTIKELNRDKDKSTTVNAKLENDMKQMTQEIENHLKEIDELKAKHAKCIQDDQSSEYKIIELEKEIKTHLTAIDELKEQLKQKENQCREQKTSIEKMNIELLSKAKRIDELEIALKDNEDTSKEITAQLRKDNSNSNQLIKELKGKISDLNEMNKEHNRENAQLNKLITAFEAKVNRLNSDIEQYEKDFDVLNNNLKQETKAARELRDELKEKKTKLIVLKEECDQYAKEIKNAIRLLSQKLTLANEDNGITYSLIELINTIDIVNKKQIERSYNSKHYVLITNVSLGIGLSWSLLKSKTKSNDKHNEDENEKDANEYKWVISDQLNLNDFNEPIEEFIRGDIHKEKDKIYQEEIEALKKEQDDLLNKLTKRENDYKTLNLQIAKILNQQKNNDKSQEKRLHQTIEELKENNRKLLQELQPYKAKGVNNKIFGVSFIKELNNNSNFMDDSNVEDLLNEMSSKRNTISSATPTTINTRNTGSLNHQQIKSNFEKLLSEIPLTASVKSSVSSILKQMHFSNEDIIQLFNRFRSGVISLNPSTSNGKLPWNSNNKN